MLTLYRGLRNDVEKNDIEREQTAGGAKKDDDARQPVWDEVKGQKGTSGECYPLAKGKKIAIPEFVEYTTDHTLAVQFARRSHLVAEIDVKEQYALVLDKDALEHGVFLRSCAPVAAVHFFEI